MLNLYQLLFQIKEKPGMYIAYPSISNLFMFLCGYEYSRQELNIPITDEEIQFQEFQPWLQKRFGLNTSASWARIILLYTIDEIDGFNTFYDLLQEFINENKNYKNNNIFPENKVFIK